MMTKKKKILITGVSGLLGNALAVYLRDCCDIWGLYLEHAVRVSGTESRKVDLADPGAVSAVFAVFRPDVVIHCAAVSNIETCEVKRDLAYAVNVRGTENVAREARLHGVQFVHISTDAIYDEVSGRPLREDDPIRPTNYYGETKRAAEEKAAGVPGALILRTNFFGFNVQAKNSLAEWVWEELSHGREIPCFPDVFFSSMYTFDLARVLKKAIDRGLQGVYNCGSRDSLSKYDFAMGIAERFGLDAQFIKAVSVDQFPFRAKRRKNLALDVGKWERALGETLPSFAESISHFVEDHRKGVPTLIKGNGRGETFPTLNFLPYGRQSIDQDDIDAVVEVMRSKNLTQGPAVDAFEAALCRETGARHAVAVNSGTSALHIACLAAGVREGDEVITAANTFVASANCVAYCGGRPVFADIDEKTFHISADEIGQRLTPRTRAVIPVHFAGQSCDMASIQEAVRKKEKQYGRKIFIIEDASHALGSRYRGAEVGSCSFSDMCVMSFHPVKHITTAEGGAVLTPDDDLAWKLQRFRSHGIVNDPQHIVYKDQGVMPLPAPDGQETLRPWYYEQVLLGYNYRITDIQCALGLSQLKKLSRFRARRREVVSRYNAAFQGHPLLTVPFEEEVGESNFHLYVLKIKFREMAMDRATLMLKLKAQGIQTQVHYIPVHTQPFYQRTFQTGWGDLPKTEAYYQECLSLPLHAAMTDQDVEKVITALLGILKTGA